jgi:methylated-DNA-protein-cysteine methyltransferase-like protein
VTERADRILARIRRIPRGSVLSYGVIDPEAPRFVGQVLSNTDADVPWHRVVHADGSIPKGERQRALLRREGVPMRGDRVDMDRARARRPR